MGEAGVARDEFHVATTAEFWKLSSYTSQIPPFIHACMDVCTRTRELDHIQKATDV